MSGLESVLAQPPLRRDSHLFSMQQEMGHEQVVFAHDPDTGLKAIIAVHSTVLGPALGGCRIWNYTSESDAVWDVMRLSRGMTLKSSISGIQLGGGKSVILAGPDTVRNEAFWKSFGRMVDRLGGTYITAEDVGTSTREIAYMMQVTSHVSGKPVEAGGTGDPSPVTAKGVFYGMKAAVKVWKGTDSLKGVKVAVQGAGHVGLYLIERLRQEGAVVYVSDIREESVKKAVEQFGAIAVSTQDIYDTDADVYAPCALGASLNSETIPKLRCAVIAGAANNQLAEESLHSQMLMDRGIIYAPDFLINAGGVINCYREVSGVSEETIHDLVEAIYDKTLHVIQTAAANHIGTHETAVNIAMQRVQEAKLKMQS